MTTLSDYAIDAELYAGRSLIFRAVRKQDQIPVIIKLMRQEYPTSGEKARFKAEYDLLQSINSEGVVKALEIINHGNGHAIVMEDFYGMDIKTWLSENQLTLEQRLDIAIRLCDIIDDLHFQLVIHKDINPFNIIINPEKNLLKLIDFELSTRFSRQEPSISDPGKIEGTPAYISPEQTGRMNRGIDYRSDYYSFGVTLYELFTGRLPFTSKDKLSLFHSHIAKIPAPMGTVNPDVPEVLSAVVAKLMDKNPEDRYQSIKGLKHDLAKCRYELKTYGEVSTFSIALKDFPERLTIPERIFGREEQIESMLERFSSACSGRPGFSLVTGSAGIGKSVLINELRQPVTAQNGLFAFGKFDQYHQDMPYQAFIEAFSTLLRQVVSSHQDEDDRWRKRISFALGKNAKLITDLIPDLEQIIGPQPEVVTLPSGEALHRFANTLRRFISVFISKEHPLVIFLDDLQWADAESLSLLMKLHKAPDIRHFYLIAAFRDQDEYLSDHLNSFLDELGKYKVLVEKTRLLPFTLKQATNYIARILSCDSETAAPLAGIIHEKTQGNPFYINQFLLSINEDGQLWFTPQKEQWEWEMSSIEKLDVTSNVLDLLTRKITKLSPSIQQTLAIAACLGGRFDTAFVSNAASLDHLDIDQHLRVSEKAGFISAFEVPAVSGYDFINTRYRFVHDRVQQAAWSTLNEKDLKSIHLRIGRLLADEDIKEDRKKNIFDIVDHYNQAMELVTDSDERKKLASLNLAAGKKAKSANAFSSAFSFLTHACNLLEGKCWQTDYSTTLTIHTEAMDAACLAGLYQEMDELGRLIFENAKNLVDQSGATEIVINSLIARNRSKEAVFYALGFLKKLDIKIHENPSNMQTLGSILTSVIKLRRRTGMDILETKKQVDPKTIAILNILSMIISPAYFSTPELLPLLIGTHINMSLKHGYSPAIGYVVISLGVILCGFFGWINLGYKLGRRGLKLAQKVGGQQFEARAMFCFHCLIQHWKEHGHSTVAPVIEASKKAMASGDMEHAALCLVFDSYHAYLLGMDLDILEKKYRENSEQIEQIYQEKYLVFARIFHQSILNLINGSSNPTKLCGEKFDEDRILPELRAAEDWSAYHSIHFNKLILCTLFEQFEEGVQCADQAEQFIESSAGTMNSPVFYFYDAICRLSLYDSSSPKKQHQILKKAIKNRKKLKKYAAHSPENYLHKLYLVDAELASVSNHFENASNLYDQAIEISGEQGFTQEQALSNERAAAFYHRKNKQAIARMYLKEACFLYRKWGAHKKAEILVRRHKFLIQTWAQGETNGNYTITHTFSSTGGTHDAAIDLESLFRAYRVISCELSMNKLLKKMMQIVLETAGAQSGCLFLNNQGQLFLEAEVTEDGEIKVLQHQPLEEQICTESKIIDHVIRTKRNICIDDLETAEMFHPLKEGKRPIPKSLLCIPLISQDTLVGLLLLTNHLARGVFRPDRVDILNILSSSISVSLENARLYQEVKVSNLTLEQKVEERTKELERLAKTDSLTKLPNRRSLLETMEYEKNRCVREKKTFALALADIDDFKKINDNHGHECGDYILFHVAELFSSSLRGQDTVARWGGEEFLFLLPETNKIGGCHIADKVRMAIEAKSFIYNNVRIPVTITFGVSLFDGSRSIDDCIRAADEKLYQGKHSGKNKVVF